MQKIAGKQPQRLRRRQAGTSLLEIMVVLVVLLIGVFAVIRIFPVGFGTLRANESRTIAGRLSRQLMEQLKADEDNLPRGVHYSFYDQSTGTRVFNTEEDPDDLRPVTNAAGRANPYFSDVNKFRFIEGEPVKIPLPTAVSGAYQVGSLYTLKFGPIYMDPVVGDPDAVPTTSSQRLLFDSYLKVYGAPLRTIRVDSNDGQNPDNYRGYVRGPQTCLVDHGDGSTAYILFAPANKERIFYVSYSYETASGSDSEDRIEMTIPGDMQYVWRPIPNPKNGGSASAQDLIEGSVTVERGFGRLKSADAWDGSDPYEYKLLSGNVAASTGKTSFANVGVLAFNPSGANYSERTVYGQRAFTAFVDYAVLDWHILREDREVPSTLSISGIVTLRTTLGFIKRAGQPEADDTIYQGLYRDAGIPVDIQIFDLQGSVARDPAVNPGLGDPLRAGDYDNRATSDADKDYWIDFDERRGTYRTGTLHINTNRVPRGSQLRILYKAEGDWAVAVQKASERYDLRFTQYPPDGEPGLFTRNLAGRQLFFHHNDLNKSIVATIQYALPNGDVKRIPALKMNIDQSFTGANGKRYAAVNVADFITNATLRNEFIAAETNWGLASDVNGVSLKTRVIWRDNNSQTNTWRIQDLDTYITRGDGS